MKKNFLLFMVLSLFAVGECLADLTGYWQSDGGSQYRLRQIGNKLFWTVNYLPSVINVFYGSIAGDIITGDWADMPGPRSLGQGSLSLRIESDNRLTKIGQTRNYGGTVWTRSSGAQPAAPAPSSDCEPYNFSEYSP